MAPAAPESSSELEVIRGSWSRALQGMLGIMVFSALFSQEIPSHHYFREGVKLHKIHLFRVKVTSLIPVQYLSNDLSAVKQLCVCDLMPVKIQNKTHLVDLSVPQKNR